MYHFVISLRFDQFVAILSNILQPFKETSEKQKHEYLTKKLTQPFLPQLSFPKILTTKVKII